MTSNVETQGEQNCSVNQELKSLSTFITKRILNNDPARKYICAEGCFKDVKGSALVLLEKQPFTVIDEDLRNDNFKLNQISANDIYGTYEFFPNVHNGVKVTVIHPASEEHIRRYELHPLYILNETPELYYTITLPHIMVEQFSLQWVYNILEYKQEAERIFFDDTNPETGFIICPDLKWDGKELQNLYCLAIVRKRHIKSLRDLNKSHLDLLKNVYSKGSKAIEDTYGLHSSQLRIYIHYQPTFYHLHIHFCYLMYDAPAISSGKAHLLSTVIQNIELMDDYYQKATLSFSLRENYNLFKKYCEKGILEVKRIPTRNASEQD